MNNTQEKALTTKELAFVVAYTAIGTDCCGQQAKSAIKAGWSEKTADQQASRLMKTDHITMAIHKIHKRMMDEGMINPHKILSDLQHVKERALAKGDLASANRSIHLQGQYLAMFKDVYQIEESVELEEQSKRERMFSKILVMVLTVFGEALQERMNKWIGEHGESEQPPFSEFRDLFYVENRDNIPASITSINRN